MSDSKAVLEGVVCEIVPMKEVHVKMISETSMVAKIMMNSLFELIVKSTSGSFYLVDGNISDIILDFNKNENYSLLKELNGKYEIEKLSAESYDEFAKQESMKSVPIGCTNDEDCTELPPQSGFDIKCEDGVCKYMKQGS